MLLDETDPLPLARDGPNAAPTLPASIRMMPVRSARRSSDTARLLNGPPHNRTRNATGNTIYFIVGGDTALIGPFVHHLGDELAAVVGLDRARRRQSMRRSML